MVKEYYILIAASSFTAGMVTSYIFWFLFREWYWYISGVFFILMAIISAVYIRSKNRSKAGH